MCHENGTIYFSESNTERPTSTTKGTNYLSEPKIHRARLFDTVFGFCWYVWGRGRHAAKRKRLAGFRPGAKGARLVFYRPRCTLPFERQRVEPVTSAVIFEIRTQAPVPWRSGLVPKLSIVNTVGGKSGGAAPILVTCRFLFLLKVATAHTQAPILFDAAKGVHERCLPHGDTDSECAAVFTCPGFQSYTNSSRCFIRALIAWWCV